MRVAGSKPVVRSRKVRGPSPSRAGQARRGVLLAVGAECRAFHLDYPADRAAEQLAWLAVAARHFTRYVQVVARLGTDHWREVEALAESAPRSKRRDLAVEIFRVENRTVGTRSCSESALYRSPGSTKRGVQACLHASDLPWDRLHAS